MMNLNVTSPIKEIDEVIPVDLYLNSILSEICLSFSGGLLLDGSIPVITQSMTLAPGMLVLISDTTYSGLWLMGSVASPAAIPLTRHPDYPATSAFKIGTTFHAAYAHPNLSEVLLETMPAPTDAITEQQIIPAEDSISSVFQWAARGNGYFRFSLLGAAVAPGGLSPGTWYYLREPVYDVAIGYYKAAVEDVSFTPVNITSTGTDDGGLGYMGIVQFTARFLNKQVIQVVEASTSGDLQSTFSDGYLTVLSSTFADETYGGVIPGTGAQAGSGSVAYGPDAGSKTSAVAVGAGARAGVRAIGIGQGANAQDDSIALGYSISSLPYATALGRGATSEAQVTFRAPGSMPDLSGMGSFQAWFHWGTWDLPTFPTLMSVSYEKAALGSSGLVLSSSSVYFDGICTVMLKDPTSVYLGTNVIRVRGVITPSESDPYSVVSFSASELFASYPGAVSLNLYPDFIGGDKLLQVEIDFSLSTDDLYPVAYLTLETRTVGTSNGLNDSLVVEPIAVNRKERGILLMASEALSAGNLVNFWADGGTAKMRKADASDDRAADGYVLQAVASGSKGYAFADGINDSASGLTVGPLYLGESGAASSSESGPGGIVQSIGFALSSTAMVFQRGLPVQS